MTSKAYLHKIRNLTLVILFGFFTIFGLSLLIKYLQFDPHSIKFLTTSSKIYDRNGEFLWEISRDNAVRSTPVSIETLPRSCIDGIVAVEDRTFWVNNGVDANGFARLILSILSGGGSGGGSTISQQVIKNSFLNIYNRDPLDKILEIIYALKLNLAIDKEKILEMYLNNVYYGELNYGIESASWSYFNKSSSDLSLAECAYIVGIPQWPGIYNPYGQVEKGRERQIIVLNAMLKEGFISQQEYENAKNFELKFDLKQIEVRAPHFVQFLKDSLFERYGEEIYSSHTVYSTYDYELHKSTISILKSFVENNKDKNINNAAAIIFDGENNLLAMVGSIDFFNDSIDGKFNSALGLRQPGTAYLPILYTISLNEGFDENSILSNLPFSIKIEREETTEFVTITNPDGSQSQSISFKDALIQNQIIPSVNLIQSFGTERLEQRLNDLKVFNKTESKCNEILILEGCEMSLMDLTSIYAVNFVKDNNIEFIMNSDLNLEFQYGLYKLSDAQRIKDLLNQNTTSGWLIQNGFTVNSKDSFAIAFNQNYTVGVWVGNTGGEELVGIGNEFVEPVVSEIISVL